MPRIFLFIFSIGLLGGFLAKPAYADQTIRECSCAVKATGESCDINDTIALPVDTNMSPLELLRRASSSDSSCRVATAAATQEALAVDTTITEQTCADLTLAGTAPLDGKNYNYEIACEMKTRTEGDSGSVIQEVHLRNPLRVSGDKSDQGIVDLNVIIGNIIKYATGILGSVTLIVFAYGGFQWLLSRGNSEMITKGLDTMIYAAIGLCIIFGSYAILATIFTGLGRAAGG